MRYKQTFAGASGKRNSLLAVVLKLRLTDYPTSKGVRYRIQGANKLK